MTPIDGFVSPHSSLGFLSKEERLIFMKHLSYRWILGALVLNLALLSSCAKTANTAHSFHSSNFFSLQKDMAPQQVLVGKASWYGPYFHGRKTASGEIYNMYAMTAAHKDLPLGSLIRVTNPNNQKQLFLKVNDRGPYIEGRILDLSYAAAKELDILQQGVSTVQIEVYPKDAPIQVASRGR